MWLTLCGLTVGEVLRQIAAGLEEEGCIGRTVRVCSTIDTGLIGLTAAPLDALNPAYDGELGQGRIAIGASLSYLAANGLPLAGDGIISGSCVDAADGASLRIFLPAVRR